MPNKFKVNTSFEPWLESFLTHLQSQTGHNNCTLDYCLRKLTTAASGAMYETERLMLQATIKLLGAAFERDNEAVNLKLKMLTVEGPAWHYISHLDTTQNGRVAWAALFDHYQGHGYHHKMRVASYKALSSMVYYGKRMNSTFEQFTTTFQKTYAELSRYGEVVSDEKQARDFIEVIKDPKLEVACARTITT